MFVVRRAYRVNDSLPGEAASQPRWLWQRGRWLLVDRNTSRISQIKLPDFDPIILMSLVSRLRGLLWCGRRWRTCRSIVAQITTRKPLCRKQLEKLGGEFPESVYESRVATPTGACHLLAAKRRQDHGEVKRRFANLTPDTPDQE